ncbi:MAG: hypothetical protein WDZ80_01935 [Candidatus Paceibacterota bacterium]
MKDMARRNMFTVWNLMNSSKRNYAKYDKIESLELDLNEGKFHNGKSEVIRLTATK